MNNRIWQLKSTANLAGGAVHRRFELICPVFPQSGPLAGPVDLHAIAFANARATVERARWQRLLRKILETDADATG